MFTRPAPQPGCPLEQLGSRGAHDAARPTGLPRQLLDHVQEDLVGPVDVLQMQHERTGAATERTTLAHTSATSPAEIVSAAGVVPPRRPGPHYRPEHRQEPAAILVVVPQVGRQRFERLAGPRRLVGGADPATSRTIRPPERT